MRKGPLAALLAAGAAVTGAVAAPVPFVGCRADGQLGPQPAPLRGRTPPVAAEAASKLAFYRMTMGQGVLAPRGWHCFGLYGSNGSTLIVAPEPLDWKRVTDRHGLTGPAVQLSTSSGGTSGRFEVAEIAARSFPVADKFVKSVEAGQPTERPFARDPYPADRRTYRGSYQLLFTTAAGQPGLGTRSRLAPSALPIDGVEWLHPPEMDLTALSVRLPTGLRPLVASIIREATPPPPR